MMSLKKNNRAIFFIISVALLGSVVILFISNNWTILESSNIPKKKVLLKLINKVDIYKERMNDGITEDTVDLQNGIAETFEGNSTFPEILDAKNERQKILSLQKWDKYIFKNKLTEIGQIYQKCVKNDSCSIELWTFANNKQTCVILPKKFSIFPLSTHNEESWHISWGTENSQFIFILDEKIKMVVGKIILCDKNATAATIKFIANLTIENNVKIANITIQKVNDEDTFFTEDWCLKGGPLLCPLRRSINILKWNYTLPIFNSTNVDGQEFYGQVKDIDYNKIACVDFQIPN